ncbi:MAG: DegV family protein, partial [Chloroflexi bacterium]|nr:DegV family protein [Chloroflexota bacterium]
MANSNTALVADSTCDIPADLIQQYGIHIVPAYVIWGEEEFRDRIDISPEEFYTRLESDPVYPKSAHGSVEDFLRAYQHVQQRGADEIITITVSSAMSGTFSAAQQAAELAAIPVHVVDSRGPTMTTGWQVLAAARAREAGGDVDAMLAAAAAARRTMVQLVLMDTLEYLQKGGRIGNAQRWLGTMLNIKPLVYIDHETGVVEGKDRIRTHRKAVEELYRSF